MNNAHPWQSAYDDMIANTLPLLQKYGEQIGKSNDIEARAVVHFYQSIFESFDPMTHILLKEALNHWIKLNVTKV